MQRMIVLWLKTKDSLLGLRRNKTVVAYIILSVVCCSLHLYVGDDKNFELSTLNILKRQFLVFVDYNVCIDLIIVV